MYDLSTQNITCLKLQSPDGLDLSSLIVVLQSIFIKSKRKYFIYKYGSPVKPCDLNIMKRSEILLSVMIEQANFKQPKILRHKKGPSIYIGVLPEERCVSIRDIFPALA